MKAASEIVFNLINVTVGILVIIQGIGGLNTDIINNFTSFVIGLYLTIIGAFVIVAEFFSIPQLRNLFMFYFIWGGRGATYLFLGGLTYSNQNTASTIFGIICFVFSFLYMTFQCFPVFYFPAPICGSGVNTAGGTGRSALLG
jgi:hypothetical protein